MIKNGRNTPLNANSGTVPNVGEAMLDWFQQMRFGVVTKEVKNSQVVETVRELSARGVIQPLTERQLMMKPEGQRAWDWYWLHAEPSLVLEVDSDVIYLSRQYRVMSNKNYSLYGYVEYHLVQDYTGAGPTKASDPC